MHFFSPEVTFALPSRPDVELLFRFHHRSGRLRAGQRRLGRGAVRDGRAAGAVLTGLAAPRGAPAKGGAAAARPSVRNLVKTERPMSRPLLLGVAAMAAIVIASNILVQFLRRRLADLGRLHLSVRLPGHRPDEPAARAGARRGGWCSRASSSGSSAASSAARSRGRSGRWSACGWRSARATAFLVGAAPRRRGLQPAARRQLVAGAVRLERSPAASLDTAIFFSIAFSAASPSSRRRSTSPGRTRRCRCSGRGPVAPLWSQPRARRFRGQARASRCSRWRRFALRSAGTLQRALKFALAFCRGAGTIGATATSERR